MSRLRLFKRGAVTNMAGMELYPKSGRNYDTPELFTGFATINGGWTNPSGTRYELVNAASIAQLTASGIVFEVGAWYRFEFPASVATQTPGYTGVQLPGLNVPKLQVGANVYEVQASTQDFYFLAITAASATIDSVSVKKAA